MIRCKSGPSIYIPKTKHKPSFSTQTSVHFLHTHTQAHTHELTTHHRKIPYFMRRVQHFMHPTNCVTHAYRNRALRPSSVFHTHFYIHTHIHNTPELKYIRHATLRCKHVRFIQYYLFPFLFFTIFSHIFGIVLFCSILNWHGITNTNILSFIRRRRIVVYFDIVRISTQIINKKG